MVIAISAPSVIRGAHALSFASGRLALEIAVSTYTYSNSKRAHPRGHPRHQTDDRPAPALGRLDHIHVSATDDDRPGGQYRIRASMRRPTRCEPLQTAIKRSPAQDGLSSEYACGS